MSGYHHGSDVAHVARMLKRIFWCDRYMHALELIVADEDLAEWCEHGYWSTEPSPHAACADLVYGSFTDEAYECGMVPKHYYEDAETIAAMEEMGRFITNPSPEFLAPLTSRQVLACIGCHFRSDHFCNGSLLEDSLPNGSLLQFMKAYREKALAEIAGYDDSTVSKALLRAFKKGAK